jgi:thiamine biosynthesis protein ThiI
VLINGESIGQVASQTLDSLHVTQAVTNTPILRPLLAFDKNTIMAKAREIGTYDISIRPFEDCCTVYVPSQPSTSPRNYYADRYERRFDYQSLVDTCVQDIKTLTVTPTSQYDFAAHGFTVKELFEERSD